MDEETQADLAMLEAWLREVQGFVADVARYCAMYTQGEDVQRLAALTEELVENLGVVVECLAEALEHQESMC